MAASERIGCQHRFGFDPGACVFHQSPLAMDAEESEPGVPLIPVGGVIDAVMREFEAPRIGFDVIGTPFATLEDSLTYYSIGIRRLCWPTIATGTSTKALSVNTRVARSTRCS